MHAGQIVTEPERTHPLGWRKDTRLVGVRPGQERIERPARLAHLREQPLVEVRHAAEGTVVDDPVRDALGPRHPDGPDVDPAFAQLEARVLADVESRGAAVVRVVGFLDELRLAAHQIRVAAPGERSDGGDQHLARSQVQVELRARPHPDPVVGIEPRRRGGDEAIALRRGDRLVVDPRVHGHEVAQHPIGILRHHFAELRLGGEAHPRQARPIGEQRPGSGVAAAGPAEADLAHRVGEVAQARDRLAERRQHELQHLPRHRLDHAPLPLLERHRVVQVEQRAGIQHLDAVLIEPDHGLGLVGHDRTAAGVRAAGVSPEERLGARLDLGDRDGRVDLLAAVGAHPEDERPQPSALEHRLLRRALQRRHHALDATLRGHARAQHLDVVRGGNLLQVHDRDEGDREQRQHRQHPERHHQHRAAAPLARAAAPRWPQPSRHRDRAAAATPAASRQGKPAGRWADGLHDRSSPLCRRPAPGAGDGRSRGDRRPAVGAAGQGF
ncbi:MAG: hypothetical protein KatS3mg102_1912 [Planctomycetota bacterium]|nr:MAG: hypothetical protein KatS3mg102_1912 [Planctomycetota bacterium]